MEQEMDNRKRKGKRTEELKENGSNCKIRKGKWQRENG